MSFIASIVHESPSSFVGGIIGLLGMCIACSYLAIAAFLRLLSLYGILIATYVFAYQGIYELSPRCGAHLNGIGTSGK